MINEKIQFKTLFDMLCGYYHADKLEKDILRLYYAGLEGFSIDEIKLAASKHMTDKKSGSFFPKIADLRKYLDGELLTPDEIIAAARLKKTPLGVLAAIHIGSHDLESMDAFYLRQRAHEVLQMLPEWQNKFNQNKISARTRETFEKFGVSVESHFQKIGESKSCDVINLEDHAKPPQKLPSAITDLANNKRTNAQIVEFRH